MSYLTEPAAITIGILLFVWLYIPHTKPGLRRTALKILFLFAGFVASCLLASVIFGIMADSLGMGEGGLAFVLFAGIPFAIVCTVFANKWLTRHVERTEES